MTLDDARVLVASVPHWHHTFEIFPGLITPGVYDPTILLSKAGLSSNLRGLRVLDIGTSDGYFALELTRRGASVVALDYRSKHDHGFHIMEQINLIDIEYHQMNIYELAEKKLGTFDIVLFMGVLYHLPDMMRALHLVRQCCHGKMYIETHSENDFCRDIPAARYYTGATLANDHTNFWAPNRLCVLDMLQDTGFDVEYDEEWGQRLFAVANAVEVNGLRKQKMELGYGLVGR